MKATESTVKELLLQALETERGGQAVYEAAIACAANTELRDEWQKYHDETVEHERILNETFAAIGFDTSETSPGREIVRAKGEALVAAMEQASATLGDAAQLVAAECVVEAETKDHMNWQLIGELASSGAIPKEMAAALKAAHEQVEDQEDEHLYHTMGWSRELWMEALGLPAVLPPPEEEKSVKTAIGQARAEKAREEMLSR